MGLCTRASGWESHHSANRNAISPSDCRARAQANSARNVELDSFRRCQAQSCHKRRDCQRHVVSIAHRHRHLRQRRPERAGRRGHADRQAGSDDGGGNGKVGLPTFSAVALFDRLTISTLPQNASVLQACPPPAAQGSSCLRDHSRRRRAAPEFREILS
jgi:hypothetical protein